MDGPTARHVDGRIDDQGTAATVSRFVSEGVAGLVMLGSAVFDAMCHAVQQEKRYDELPKRNAWPG